MEKESAVKVDSIVKTFNEGQVIAVNNISLDVSLGQLVTLLGPSGCGKTTLLRTIAGFETPDSGRIMVRGRDITALNPSRRGVGMVFQNYALFPHMTVSQNVAYGLEMRSTPREEIQERVTNILSLAEIGDLGDRPVANLSGGQQQRVALARALVIEPDVLLLDEPLSNLDAKLRRYMREEIRALQQRLGITAIYVTHDQEEAMAISDEIAVIHNGRVQQVGKPRTVYQTPTSELVANFMGHANWIMGTVTDSHSDDGSVYVEAHGATIPVRIPNGAEEKVRPGMSLRVLSRPESLLLSNESGLWEAEVLDSAYISGFVHYRVQVGDSEWAINDLAYPGKEAWDRGSKVWVDAHQGAFQCPEVAAPKPEPVTAS